MDFVLTPTLKHRALVSVAATFWDSHNIKTCAENFIPLLYLNSLRDRKREWSKISRTVQARAKELVIPKSVKEQLLRAVDGMGWEIYNWLYFHLCGLKIVKTFPNKFFWTSHGTIEKKQTALALMHDETLDSVKRFKLACLNCLEEHIFALWEDVKVDINKELSKSYMYDFAYINFLIYWRNQILQKSSHWLKPSVGMRQTVLDGNLAAFKYFLPKLTEKDKNEKIFEAILSKLRNLNLKDYKYIHSVSDTPGGETVMLLCLVLQNMNETLQLKTLKRFPMEVLNLSLEWPCQKNFMKWYKYLEQFLSPQEFCFLLECIIYKKIYGHEDCDYQNLYIQLWLNASINVRQGVFNSPGWAISLLSVLYEIEDWNTLNLVLEQATPKQREQLLSDQSLYVKTCKKCIDEKRWNAFECFITKCLKSEHEMTAFRDGMNNFVYPYISESSYREFNQLFNKHISNNHERCFESHNSNPNRL